jgi:phosphohistidine phosphatase SixA
MGKKTILVMRHAEKSSDPLDPDLTDAGRNRAQRLVDYVPKTFGPPEFLFASGASKHSRRPIETLEPLATQCRLKIDSTYADQDYGALAHHLRNSDDFNDVLTVVCWHHGNIPNLMNALKAASTDYPDPWKRDVFNLILRVELAKRDDVPTVERIIEPF